MSNNESTTTEALSPNKESSNKESSSKKEGEASTRVENKKEESAMQENKPEKKQDKKAGNKLVYLILLIIIGSASAAAYYFWDLQLKHQATMAQQQRALDVANKKISQLAQDIKKTTQSSNNNTQKINGLSRKIKQTETISQQAIEIVNRNQRDWAMAEVDYLLRIAHQRIAVAKDIDGAIAALKGADARIQQLGDLNLFEIRKQLAKDIGNLNAIHQADVNGISLALDQMISILPNLAFKSAKDEIKIQFTENDLIEQPKIEKQSFVDSMIETVKQIGEIKVHKRSIQAASSGVQQNSIEQLLRTYLLGARLAALRFDQTQFIHEIHQASELLRLHYDEKDNRVQNLQKSLLDYSSLQLNPDLPELTKAWTMLQKKMNSPTLKTVKAAVTKKENKIQEAK